MRHKGVASEIEGGRRVGQRGMESEAEGGGQKGVESEGGARKGVESEAGGWRVRQGVGE